MNKIAVILVFAVLWFSGVGAARAQEGRFSYKGEALPKSILRPWIEERSQAGYAGRYRFEAARQKGDLMVNAYLKNGSNIPGDFVLDAVRIGPAREMQKKAVKTSESFYVRGDGWVRIGDTDLMRACLFVHPKTKEQVRGFLISGAFFGKEE